MITVAEHARTLPSPRAFLSLRNGRLLISPKGRQGTASSPNYIPVPLRFQYMASYVFVTEFPFLEEECPTIRALYEYAGRDPLSFVVAKNRNPRLLDPFQHPDPYTDDHKIKLSFDDMMMIYLSL